MQFIPTTQSSAIKKEATDPMNTPTNGRFGVIFALWAGFGGLVGAQPNQQAERDRLVRERQAAEAEFQRADIACDKRFMQSDCVLTAKRQRRERLDALRREEVALNDQVRRNKAAAAVQRVEQLRLDANSLAQQQRVQNALRADQERRDRVSNKTMPKAPSSKPAREPDPLKVAQQPPRGQGADVKAEQQKMLDEQRRQEKALANVKTQTDRERDYADRKAALAKRVAESGNKAPAAPLPAPRESDFPRQMPSGTAMPAWDAKPAASAPTR
jgi:colicin import membrane protein